MKGFFIFLDHKADTAEGYKDWSAPLPFKFLTQQSHPCQDVGNIELESWSMVWECFVRYLKSYNSWYSQSHWISIPKQKQKNKMSKPKYLHFPENITRVFEYKIIWNAEIISLNTNTYFISGLS